MHVAIDIREATNPLKTGKGLWTKGFLDELLKRNIPLTTFSDRAFPSRAEEITFSDSRLAWHLHVARALRTRKDITHYISPTSYIVPALSGATCKIFPVVHDLIAFRGEPHDRKASFIERMTLGRAVRRATGVLTVSDTTKKDLIDRFPDLDAQKVHSIFAGPKVASVRLSEPDGKTILCIGTLCPRKNQKRLIQAFAALPEFIRVGKELILAGPRGWHDDEIISLAKETPGVTWKSYVSDEEYESLLHRATVVALPSLYEGFGLLVLDALQRGIPTLISDRGSLTEVAGESCVKVDPENISSIAAGLQKLLTDAVLRETLHVSGPVQAERFSWKRTVDLALQTLET